MKNNLISASILLFLLFCFSACKNRNPKESKQDSDVVISELKTATINGYTIHYIDIGKGESVVFVHGGVGDYRTWEAQMDPFAQGHRVIAYSRRFAYPNEQVLNESNDYSVTTHSKDLTQFLKTLDVGPVHLIGHSYGAFTSLMTALEHPELVRSLTLGEPPVMSLLQNIPNGDKIGNDFFINALIPTAEAFKNKEDEKAVELFIGKVLTDSLYFSKAPKQQKDLMMDNAFGLRGVVTSPNAFPPINCDEIKTLKMPVLLIEGDRSPEVLSVIIDALDSCIDNNEVATLSNTSHGLEYENPIEFNKVVLEFINKH